MSGNGGLDTFLDMFDEDPDWDSSDDDDPFKKLDDQTKLRKATASAKNVNISKSQPQDGKELKFEDIFGEPIQTKSGTTGEITNGNANVASARTKSLPTTPTVALKPAAAYPPYNGAAVQKSTMPQPQGSIIIDPFSKACLIKSSINIAVDSVSKTLQERLQERNMGMQQVCLSTIPRWFRAGGNKDKVEFWTTGVLARKPPGLRKSSKGNDYSLWEVIDLKNVEQSWTVFLFGTAALDIFVTSIATGTLVDLLNPSILEGSAGAGLKLSVNNANQIRRIGVANDFGYCQSKRKDGKPCTAGVNKFDCPVCIHHASAELRKVSRKKNDSWSTKKGKNSTSRANEIQEKYKKNNIITTNFSPLAPLKPKPPTICKKQLVRMELQDPSNILKRNPASLGNHSSITFKKEVNPLQLPKLLKKETEKKNLVLDPLKTRHLTEKDRQILEALSTSPASNSNSELPTMLSNPNAGSRNFLKYLNRSDGKCISEVKEMFTKKTTESEVGTKLTMTRKTLLSMQTALSYVKKNGPILKQNPNKTSKITKRKLSEVESDSSKDLSNTDIADATTKKSAQLKEFENIVSAKSAHADLAEDLQEKDYFEKLERKEAVENKLLNTFKIPTNAVMCRECKYVALSRSDLCKDLGHEIRIVKAIKRFFKCKFCGNRAMSLDRLPKRPCTNCKSSSWMIAPAGREKAGPTLASESLSIRGDEEKFLGSSSGRLFLN